jgi:acyl-CoA thioesterase
MRLHFESLAHRAEQELARRLRATRPARLFGFTLEGAEPGRAVLRMPVKRQHMQVHGVMHGGFLAALADTAGALGIYLVVPRGTRLATIEMKINYLEPVERGVLTAEGRLLRRGRNFAVSECDIHNDERRLVAKALITYSISKSGGAGTRKAARRR